jgi:hypothetical protein
MTSLGNKTACYLQAYSVVSQAITMLCALKKGSRTHKINRLLTCPLIHRPYRPFANNRIIDLFLHYAFISLQYFVIYSY